MANIIIEACCSDIESVLNAKRGSADRIELCSALETGGVTPSIGLIEAAVEIFGRNVMVLVRPRTGDFAYSPYEINVMLRDIRYCSQAGAGGVVIGALTPSGAIDTDAVAALIAAAGDMEVVFHRAFDYCNDPIASLALLTRLGVRRILTSGKPGQACENLDILSALVKAAGDDIQILPGGGITAENVAALIKNTGCTQIHASAKTARPVNGTVSRDMGTQALTSADKLLEIRHITETL